MNKEIKTKILSKINNNLLQIEDIYTSSIDIQVCKNAINALYPGLKSDSFIELPIIYAKEKFSILEIKPFINQGWLAIAALIQSNKGKGYTLLFRGAMHFFLENDFNISNFYLYNSNYSDGIYGDVYLDKIWTKVQQ